MSNNIKITIQKYRLIIKEIADIDQNLRKIIKNNIDHNIFLQALMEDSLEQYYHIIKNLTYNYYER